MAKYPRFRVREPITQISASGLNAAMQAIEDLEISVRGLEQIVRGPKKVNANPLPAVRVVVTKDPIEADMVLVVRAAKYQKSPPAPCEKSGQEINCHISWSGIEFEAYPEMGSRAIDYGDFFWNGEDDGFDDTTKFLWCWKMNDYWEVFKPAVAETSAVRFARLFDMPVTDSEVVSVVRVKRVGGLIVDDIPEGEAVEDHVEQIECFPGMTGFHFQPIYRADPAANPPNPTRKRQYVTLVFVLDRWIAIPEYRVFNAIPDPDVPFGGCPNGA